MKWLFIPLISVIILICATVHAADVPKLQGHVNDYANMISAETKTLIEEQLKSLEQSDSTQIFVLTVPSLEGESIEEFAIKVFDVWKAGQKNKDNGVLLIAAQKERKLRIEVGRGLEGRLTDLVSGRIIDNVMVPKFREGDYNGGFIAGISALVQATKGEYTAEDSQPRSGNMIDRLEAFLIQRPDNSAVFALLVILIVFFLGIWGNIHRIPGFRERSGGMRHSKRSASRKTGWLPVIVTGAVAFPIIAFLTISAFKILAFAFYVAVGAVAGLFAKAVGGGSFGGSSSSYSGSDSGGSTSDSGSSSGGGGESGGGGASGDY